MALSWPVCLYTFRTKVDVACVGFLTHLTWDGLNIKQKFPLLHIKISQEVTHNPVVRINV